MRSLLRVALAIAAAVVALAYGAYWHDIDLSHERVSTGSQIVQTPCGPIEYASAGEGDPVLVVHGAGGGFDQGMDFAKGLVAGGLRVVTMSRFGYLRTPRPADASPAARGTKAAGTMRISAVQRSGWRSANCIDEGAPAEAPMIAARLRPSASSRQACASACAAGEASCGKGVRR